MIESCKVVTGKVDHAKYVFKLSRSDYISKISNSSGSEVCKIRKYFLPERIRNYWNKLPVYVKLSENVLDFKINSKLSQYIVVLITFGKFLIQLLTK